MAGHTRRVLLIAAGVFVTMAIPVTADACPICFRESDSPLTAGVMAGVGTLLTITASVLGGVGVIARRLIRAERAAAQTSEERR